MSEPNLNTSLSPVNYLNKVYGQMCQEMGLSPQEIMNLLMFQFMQIEPEQRELVLNDLKIDFRKFTQTANFEGVAEVINSAIEKEELKLYNWLQDSQDDLTSHR